MVIQINSDRMYAKRLFISLWTDFYSAVHIERLSLVQKKVRLSGYCRDPVRFVKCEQNVVKCAQKGGGGREGVILKKAI